MKKFPLIALVTAGSLFSACSSMGTRPTDVDMKVAMEQMMKDGMPGEEHKEMAKQVGTWKTTMTYRDDADSEWQTMTGTCTYESMFDGRFIVGRERGMFEMEGQQFPHESMMIMGYDNLKKEYTTSYYSSMSTWSGELRGTKNADGDVEYSGVAYDHLTPQGRPSKALAQNEGDDKMVFKMWDSIGGEMVHTMTWTAERMR